MAATSSCTPASDGSATARVDAWAERMAARPPETDRVRLGAAIHSVRAVRREDLPQVVAAAGSLPLHVHLSEQHGENHACQMFYGHTPTELLDEAGALGSNLTSIHATHLTEHDIELLGGTGTGACICPTTERDLADGIGPSRALHDAGSPISLGSDQNVIIDPFVELRGIEMHERLVTNERDRFSANDLLLAGLLQRLPGARLVGRRPPLQGGPRRLRHGAHRHRQHGRLGARPDHLLLRRLRRVDRRRGRRGHRQRRPAPHR